MVAGFRKATWESPLLAGVSFPWVKAGVGVGGKKAPSSSSWQRGRGKSEVGRSWFPRRLHPVGYSPSLSGTGSPDLGVFWQASCHGDVNVQHHPLNPPPQRIRHIFPFPPWLSAFAVAVETALQCAELSKSPSKTEVSLPSTFQPPPPWPFSLVPKRTGIRGRYRGPDAGGYLYGLPNGHRLLPQENGGQGTEPLNL